MIQSFPKILLMGICIRLQFYDPIINDSKGGGFKGEGYPFSIITVPPILTLI